MRKTIIGVVPTLTINEGSSPFDDQFKFINSYVKKREDAGGIPIGLLMPDGNFNEEALKICDGFLIPGGSVIRKYIYQIIHYAITNNHPLLGICLAGRYKITIGQNGGVRAPTHADSLFGFLRNLKTINGNVNTSQTKTMSYMFYSTGANVNSFIADLSNWNVSNVTDMSNLFVFSGFNSLIWNVGNLNNWDVSNVVNMSGVFSSAGYSATTWNIGDLSNWNVSNVTNMTQTFCFSGFTSAS